MTRSYSKLPNFPPRQHGAALFISLMVLILLTLLALSASQVTGLQEQMASIYRADNNAFQSAERGLRDQERQLLVTDVDCERVPVRETNGNLVDEGEGRMNMRVENLTRPGFDWGRGIAFGSSQQRTANTLGSVGCLVFRISSFDVDNPAEPTSGSVVQSIYIK